MVNKKTKKGGANININNNKSLFIGLDENDYIIEGSITSEILTELINREYNFMLNDIDYKEFLNYYYVGIEEDFIRDANLVLDADNKITTPVEMKTGQGVNQTVNQPVFQRQQVQAVYGGSKKKTRKNKNKKKKTKRKIKKSKQIKCGGYNPPDKEMKKKGLIAGLFKRSRGPKKKINTKYPDYMAPPSSNNSISSPSTPPYTKAEAAAAPSRPAPSRPAPPPPPVPSRQAPAPPPPPPPPRVNQGSVSYQQLSSEEERINKYMMITNKGNFILCLKNTNLTNDLLINLSDINDYRNYDKSCYGAKILEVINSDDIIPYKSYGLVDTYKKIKIDDTTFDSPNVTTNLGSNVLYTVRKNIYDEYIPLQDYLYQTQIHHILNANYLYDIIKKANGIIKTYIHNKMYTISNFNLSNILLKKKDIKTDSYSVDESTCKLMCDFREAQFHTNTNNRTNKYYNLCKLYDIYNLFDSPDEKIPNHLYILKTNFNDIIFNLKIPEITRDNKIVTFFKLLKLLQQRDTPPSQPRQQDTRTFETIIFDILRQSASIPTIYTFLKQLEQLDKMKTGNMEANEEKKLYRKLSLITHPDKNQGNEIIAAEIFKLVGEYHALFLKNIETNA
jgi:hypothetical protein